jgi:hypothetical protein
MPLPRANLSRFCTCGPEKCRVLSRLVAFSIASSIAGGKRYSATGYLYPSRCRVSDSLACQRKGGVWREPPRERNTRSGRGHGRNGTSFLESKKTEWTDGDQGKDTRTEDSRSFHWKAALEGPISDAERIKHARVRATPDGRDMTPDDIQAADLSKLSLEQRMKAAPLLLDIAPGTDAAMLNKRRWVACRLNLPLKDLNKALWAQGVRWRPELEKQPQRMRWVSRRKGKRRDATKG